MLLHDLIRHAAERHPRRTALVDGVRTLDYAALQAAVQGFAEGLRAQPGFGRGARVAVWLDHRLEHVVACFGTAAAGGIFVPVNPVLKPDQVSHVLRDAGAVLLVTSAARLAMLDSAPPTLVLEDWTTLGRPWPRGPSTVEPARGVDADPVALLYTSGSTGRPKGVVLSHRNLVAGAHSVAGYLGNTADDTLLAALPLSFDAGFSQLTTAFSVGARVVLINYLLPRDLLRAVDQHGVTGLTAVPPLYLQLTQALDAGARGAPASTPQDSPGAGATLRYFATTGGRMPRATLDRLRHHWPQARPYLMYGLTEAFRSTYLPPEQVDARPDSIGRAIPNAEILVLREDGTECGPDEPGELVHRGPLVSQGYWNDPEKTAERFRPLPAALRPPGMVFPELAVYSGDTVRRDAEGYLYFVGRRDEMIKTSGYRVSPTEVEEMLYATGLVGECAACGVEHPALGQAIHVVATPPEGAVDVDTAALLVRCRRELPAYMVPAMVHVRAGALPRNPNGKIDRRRLAAECAEAAERTAPAGDGA